MARRAGDSPRWMPERAHALYSPRNASLEYENRRNEKQNGHSSAGPRPFLNAKSIRELLRDVQRGKVSPDEAVDRLRHMPFEDLGFAKVDHHRALRVGMPEVIFGQGK